MVLKLRPCMIPVCLAIIIPGIIRHGACTAYQVQYRSTQKRGKTSQKTDACGKTCSRAVPRERRPSRWEAKGALLYSEKPCPYNKNNKKTRVDESTTHCHHHYYYCSMLLFLLTGIWYSCTFIYHSFRCRRIKKIPQFFFLKINKKKTSTPYTYQVPEPKCVPQYSYELSYQVTECVT